MGSGEGDGKAETEEEGEVKKVSCGLLCHLAAYGSSSTIAEEENVLDVEFWKGWYIFGKLWGVNR